MDKILHGLLLVPGMSYFSLKKLFNFFGSFYEVWKNIHIEKYEKAGLTLQLIEKLLHVKKSINLDAEYEKLAKHGIVTITAASPEYPALLRQISNPPFLLYRKGTPLSRFTNCIAIVGTRLPSSYGENMAFKLAEAITLQNGVVISGLAFGIDAKAHLGAVKHKKPTIAVLASGLLKITPASHTHLAQQIINSGGTIISEYPVGDPSYKFRYHERNRLISGLSKATIIIEARKRSGALITAYHALEQNRPIYVLPGDITRPQAQGCLHLLAEGAQPIISLEETMKDLGFETPGVQQTITIAEKILLAEITQSPSSTEDLLQKTGLPWSELNTLLTSLELKGLLHKNQGLQWEISYTGSQ